MEKNSFYLRKYILFYNMFVVYVCECYACVYGVNENKEKQVTNTN